MSEDIQSDTSRDIVVYANRGRLVRFYGGDYSVVNAEGKNIIRGKGTLFLDERMTQSKPFVGDIAFEDIQRIETREKKTLYYTGPIIFGSIVLVSLLLLLSFNGRGLGG